MYTDISIIPRSRGGLAGPLAPPAQWVAVGGCSLGCIILARDDLPGYRRGVAAALLLALALTPLVLLLPP